MAGYKFFSNRECEYFPCHEGVSGGFNCLFCYCPLYALGDKCGGDLTYLEDGTKDCSSCLIPHSAGGYDFIMSRWDDVRKLAMKG